MNANMRAGAALTEEMIARLSDRSTCPLCLVGVLRTGVCPECGSDLRDDRGAELWRITALSIDALAARRRWMGTIIATADPAASSGSTPPPHGSPERPAAPGSEALIESPGAERQGNSASYAAPSQPTAPRSNEPGRSAATARSGAASPVAPPSGSPAPGAWASAAKKPPAPTTSASLQSVLAVAGAGLFAVAAVVFSFFNADLSSPAQRLPIVGGIAVVFTGLAWILSRRRLAFSAEAIGALGMVFVALTIATASQPVAHPWLAAAIGTAIGAVGAVALGRLVRLRSWVWMGLVGLSFVPAMIGWGMANWTGALIGHVLAAATACALVSATRLLEPRFAVPLDAERHALTAVQLAIGAAAIPLAPVAGTTLTGLPDTIRFWAPVALTAAALGGIALASVGHPLRRWWSFSAGALLTGAFVFGALMLSPRSDDVTLAFTATGAAVALVVVGALMPRPRRTSTAHFLGGIIAVGAWPALLAGVVALRTVSDTVGQALFPYRLSAEPTMAVILAVAFALLILSVAVALFGRLAIGRAPGFIMITRPLALALAIAACLVAACMPVFGPAGTSIADLVIVSALALLSRLPGTGTRHPTVVLRTVAGLGAHAALVLATVISWSSLQSAVALGGAVIAGIALSATLVTARFRFLHVGAGYAYALVMIAASLHLLGLHDIIVLCLTSAIGSLGAVVATFLPRPRARGWMAILVVTAVPYLLGVVQVLFERSGWTALSTGAMFVLTLTLLLTRHRPVSTPIRSAAAFLLLPTLAVMTTCLCAQLPASGSPVALPIVAVLVALTLASGSTIEDLLIARRLPATSIGLSRVAIEFSALLTGAITILLSLTRVAAGLPTAALVFLILAVGGAGAALWSARRYGWWLAGACATAALWCVWGLLGITELEPYLLPPTVGAVLIALWLTARGHRAVPLYGAGIALAIVPILVVLGARGTPGGGVVPWRAWGLIAAAWTLSVVALTIFRRSDRWRELTRPSLSIAIVASAAAVVQSVRWGIGWDALASPLHPVAAGLLIGAAAAIPAAAAAIALPERHRGVALLAPLMILLASSWPLMGEDAGSMWTMWSVMIATLALMVVIAVLRRRGIVGLPPVAAVFVLAFVTSVVAWSTRELRVEWFSLPLGFFLLAAGLVFRDRIPSPAAPAGEGTRGNALRTWPAGVRGSWALLGPGAAVTVLASIIATFTDPQTWRAILVIVLALIAILWGARAKLRAPFLIGVIVLPIENVFVFAVQFGRGIESMPWWITLAVVGAVLLILAVTYERREGEDTGITARLRDLR